MLPKLQWFQGLAEAAQVFAMVWEDVGGDAGKVHIFLSPKPPPDAWMAAGRHGVLFTGSALEGRQEVVWEVPRAELGKVIEGAAGSRRGFKLGPSWFWGGCFWEVDLRLFQPGLELQFCVATRSEACLPRPPVLSASYSTACQLPDGSWQASAPSLRWFKSGVGYCRSSLAFPAPLKSMQQLEPHLRDGRLVLKAKVWDVR